MSESEKDRLHRLWLEQVMVRRADMHMWAECMAIPEKLFSGESNYASAATENRVYGASPISADGVRSAIDAARAAMGNTPDFGGTAYLVVPPKMRQEFVQFTTPSESEDAYSRTLWSHRMDYALLLPTRGIRMVTDIGDWSYEPPYKPRPLPEEVAPASLAQWLVLFGVGILILSMMFIAVRSL